MESVEEVKRKSKGKESRFGRPYGFELKLRCVKLRLEEGLPISLLSKEAGVSKDVIYRWVKAYQERGEAGLRNQIGSSGNRRKLPGPVREKMTDRRGVLPVIVGGKILTEGEDFYRQWRFGYPFHSWNFSQVRRVARSPCFGVSPFQIPFS